jgi:glutaredoxin-like protein NrdH
VTITVYGRPECGQCEQTKKQLERKGLSYNEVNVDEDAEARKMVQESAEHLRPSTILPMVVVKRPGKGDVTVWHGFRYDNIKDLTKDS